MIQVPDNSQWPEWMFEYDYEGSTYAFSIHAPTATDARRRVARIGVYGRFVGELKAKVAVPRLASRPASWVATLVCWWKNR